MVTIKTEKNESEDDDFNVEIKVSDEALDLTRRIYPDDGMGDIELVDTVLLILMDMYNTNHGDVIPLKYTESFRLLDSDEHVFELVVSLIKDTFKGKVHVKESNRLV